MKKFKIAYLIPVYNSLSFLEDCYKSLLMQTFNEFSIIFVDDGSNDGSLHFLEKLKLNDERIILIKTAHKGIVNALNKGLEACDAEWILRLDADDMCRKKRTEEIYFLINNISEKIALITTDVTCIDECGNVLRNLDINGQNIKRKLFSGINPIFHPSVAIRKSALINIGSYTEKFSKAEDFDLWFRIIRNYEFIHLDKKLIYYRVHKNQVKSRFKKTAVSERYNSIAFYISKTKKNKLLVSLSNLLGKLLIHSELNKLNYKHYFLYQINLIIYLWKIYEVLLRSIFYRINNYLLS